jgi:4-hydroxy-tetrahydrodipicolinate synthase
MSLFAGIWVALVTPFQHQAVDHAALRKLVAHQRQAGVHGLVALGSTGEASALDEAEQDAVLATILSEAGDLPVIAGLSGQHVGQVHQRLQTLKRLPLAGLLCPAPSYVRPSQAGLIDYFSRLADESVAPVLLYDIPYRSGVALSVETILMLAEHPQITGIKDCGGSLDKTQALIADGRLAVLCGEDHLIFHHLCLGAQGAISATANVLPDRLVAMYEAISHERLAAARQLHHALMPQVQALFAEPNPGVVKAALAQQGWCTDEVRPPMLAASEASRQRLQLVQGLGAPQPFGQVAGVAPEITARKSTRSACQ